MVKIITQGLNVEVTEALEEHIQTQLGKVVEKFEGFVVENIDVTLSVGKHHKHLRNCSVKVPIQGNDIIVEDSSDDLYKLITTVSQNCVRQVRKVKEKSVSHKGRNKRTDQSTIDD